MAKKALVNKANKKPKFKVAANSTKNPKTTFSRFIRPPVTPNDLLHRAKRNEGNVTARLFGQAAKAFLSGNLCYQVDHHLYPDLPSNRYAEIAQRVRAAPAMACRPTVMTPSSAPAARRARNWNCAVPRAPWRFIISVRTATCR